MYNNDKFFFLPKNEVFFYEIQQQRKVVTNYFIFMNYLNLLYFICNIQFRKWCWRVRRM